MRQRKSKMSRILRKNQMCDLFQVAEVVIGVWEVATIPTYWPPIRAHIHLQPPFTTHIHSQTSIKARPHYTLVSLDPELAVDF